MSEVLDSALTSAISTAGVTPQSGAAVEGMFIHISLSLSLPHTHTHTHTHTRIYYLPSSSSSSSDVVKAARDNSSLVEALGEEFHATVRGRLEQDPDYNPERFPSAHKFYKPNK